jgi:hypothetical protein
MDAKNLLFLAVGFGAGYFVAKRTLENRYIDQMNREVEEAKAFYEHAYQEKKLREKTPTENEFVVSPKVAEAATALTTYQTGGNVRLKPEPFITSEQVSDGKDKMASNKYLEPPYVINRELFFNSDTEYEQYTMTWYAGDETLVNQSDRVVEEKDVDFTVGRENLNKFGEESGDPNVVYIRCEALEMDFEIVKSDGSYAKEVLGETG